MDFGGLQILKGRLGKGGCKGVIRAVLVFFCRSFVGLAVPRGGFSLAV